MSPKEIQDIMRMIFARNTYVGRKPAYPLSIYDIVETPFFRSYNNSFDGYFVKVLYSDGLSELWFIVDLCGCCEDDWYIERIDIYAKVRSVQQEQKET